jgi:plasmid stabilization system protein ParE
LLLNDWPKIGVAVPAIDPEARMLVEPPYVIFYRLISGGTQIVRILHGARNLTSNLFLEGLNSE